MVQHQVLQPMQATLLTESQAALQTGGCAVALQHFEHGLEQLGAEAKESLLQRPGHADKRLLVQEV